MQRARTEHPAKRLALALLVVAACERPDARAGSGAYDVPAASQAAPSPSADPAVLAALETLRAEETALRARTDFETLAPSSRSLGSNPYAIAPLPGAAERQNAPVFAAVLRGDSAVVLLDARGKELARLPTMLSPSAIAALPDGRLFVTGDIEPRVLGYRIQGSRLVAGGDFSLPAAESLRAVAADSQAVYVADFWGDRLYARAVDGAPEPLVSEPLAGGPIRLALSERYLGAVCLFDHSIAIFERNADGVGAHEIKRITHDGPLFGFSLLERRGELFVAAGGVEDHPLDRGDKAFGYVDSFVYLYRLDAAKRLERVFSLNASELGVVTPKIVRLAESGAGLRMTVVGYASDAWLELEWDEGSAAPPRVVATHTGIPGCSDLAVAGERRLCADPLLDAWVELDGERALVHPERAPLPRDPSPAERLGEALFFTTLMAPDATSAGRRSRFTCETCHFEGATDGRVHHSGRGQIQVSTRPLLGLFNDAPHFSRAHDRDLTSVSHNEFAVANRGNPIDPWFSLSKARFPWLETLGVREDSVPPLELRRALLVFLARFSHAENPLAVRRETPRRFADDERRGAELFRARCVGCHAARLVARDATKDVPFERWEALVLSPAGPIVWSNGEYEKTGVTPYVDPKGTRTPSLRRLYLKRPYLTNGSAPTLEALVSRARFSEREFFHAEPPEPERARSSFGVDEARALVAFLRVL